MGKGLLGRWGVPGRALKSADSAGRYTLTRPDLCGRVSCVTEATAMPQEAELLTRLRAGEESAFMALVGRYGPLMLRIALSHVSSRAVAEEVVQESWLGVLQGLDRFE